MSNDNVMDIQKRRRSGQPVEVQLVKSFMLTRWPCHVCGGHTDKLPVLAEVQGGEHDGFRVCETCIRNRDFDEKLHQSAERLEAQAAELRSLGGRLRVPSYREWEAAMLNSDAGYMLEVMPKNAAIEAGRGFESYETLTREQIAKAYGVTVADAEKANWRARAERLKAERECGPVDDFDDDCPF